MESTRREADIPDPDNGSMDTSDGSYPRSWTWDVYTQAHEVRSWVDSQLMDRSRDTAQRATKGHREARRPSILLMVVD